MLSLLNFSKYQTTGMGKNLTPMWLRSCLIYEMLKEKTFVSFMSERL